MGVGGGEASAGADTGNREGGDQFVKHRRQWLFVRVQTVKAALKLERALLRSTQLRLKREQTVDVPMFAELIRAYARGGDCAKLKKMVEYCKGRRGGLDALNGCDRGYSMQATHCAAATGAVDCLRILLHLNRSSEYAPPDEQPDRAFLPLSQEGQDNTHENDHKQSESSLSNAANSAVAATGTWDAGTWDVQPTFLRSLVRKGLVLDITKRDAQGGTVLHHAALGGHDSTMVYVKKECVCVCV